MNKIMECLAGGGAYGKYVRVEFAGGRAVTKPAAVAQKDFTDGLFVTRSITLTADETGGLRPVRVGLTDRADGEELVGGAAVTAAGSGELERVVSFTLTLARPDGWLGSEKLFDMLTGLTPFGGDLAARTERGETVSVTPVFTDDGVEFVATLTGGMKRLTLTCDGEDALLLNAPPCTVTETSAVGQDCEYHPAAALPLALVGVTSGGAAVGATGIVVPAAVGAEKRLPLKFGGRLSACGEYLVLTDADGVRIYGAGFKPLASRSAKGVTDCAVTASGTFAVADSERLRVCRGGRDICELPVAALSVALVESGGGTRLHYLAGGLLVGVDIDTASGAWTQVYATPTDCCAIVDRGACVLGVARSPVGRSRYYTADGELTLSNTVSDGEIVAVAGKSRGLFLLKTTKRSTLINPFVQYGLTGDGKALSGRLVLTETLGKTQFVRLGEVTDETVCVTAADDMAVADRLYYRRGDALFCRDITDFVLCIAAETADGDITAEIATVGELNGGVTVRIGLKVS